MDAEPALAAESITSEFTRLLEYLKASRGFDFRAYKVSSLMRRVQKRMREVEIESYAAYADYLEVHPDEFGPLFDTVLINVTSFFRDAPAWEYLKMHILPRILEQKVSAAPIRIWCAGCASGEEAYSLAMLMAEAIGEDGLRLRAKIYATDADEGALAAARQGIYDQRHVEGVPAELLEKYFEKAGGRYHFRSDLRRCLIFGRHDLVQDAAISRLDLLACRNTLMYFNAEAQEKILARFHFALHKEGYLFLGKAETLLSHNRSFKPVDLKHRIFASTTNSNLRDRLLALSPGAGKAEPNGGTSTLRIREASFEANPVAQIAVDRRGHLALANDKARRMFSLSPADVGRLVQDLGISYRPVELRSHIEQAYESRSPVQLSGVEWRLAGSAEPRHLEIQVVPLFDGKGALLGASIAFPDVSQAFQLRADLERAHQELETAYEELQSANEELETTNEELQSTVEELETTNEELQSANEELETMNEELQSTNEEQRTLNVQLQQSSEDLNLVNSYFEAVLTGLKAAVVVLDRSLQVRIWSEKAEDLWGLRREEIEGRPFLDLDIGLPVRELREPLRHCLAGKGQQAADLDAVNRRGKSFRCRIRCTPHPGGNGGIDGIILLMEESERG
ncbi:MAG: CheR family methyltransferase [Thermoanaerobaculia bacterium]